ncbi:hypothetical protein B0H17DRAFT_169620 [Mycena rosella]|uniref:Uncharacterized protein n=1 Tax=Mycena rosella TaxID=1033263 RepID=A0AAD7D0Y2_MYCRO|nr:hypothetical protein B0H17DRAFT_169620 [Mycena rosella]
MLASPGRQCNSLGLADGSIPTTANSTYRPPLSAASDPSRTFEHLYNVYSRTSYEILWLLAELIFLLFTASFDASKDSSLEAARAFNSATATFPLLPCTGGICTSIPQTRTRRKYRPLGHDRLRRSHRRYDPPAPSRHYRNNPLGNHGPRLCGPHLSQVGTLGVFMMVASKRWEATLKMVRTTFVCPFNSTIWVIITHISSIQIPGQC